MRKLKIKKREPVDALFYSITGGALSLQSLMLYDISTKGYFRAIEPNPYVLGVEIASTTFGDYLFLYKFTKFLKQHS